MKRILQFVPTLMPGDATGMHALMIERSLKSIGIETKIYVEEIKEGQIGNVARFTEYAKENNPSDIVIYHLAAPSAIADFLSSRHETLVLVYHNITPASYFEPWDQVAATGQIWARAQLSRLAPRTTLALPVSKFNQAELIQVGYGKTEVVPIILDPSAFVEGHSDSIASKLSALTNSGRENFLFVGRLVPNKAQHNLIAALSAYNKIYDKNAVLHLVGRPFSKEYLQLLENISIELGVADNIDFAMGVSSEQLATYYKYSDAFICLSEHEGFCVPLLEAMHNQLPIVAYNSSAIKETLDQAGILLDQNDPVTCAVAMNKTINDHNLKQLLGQSMNRRLEELSPKRSGEKLINALREIAEIDNNMAISL